MLNSLKDRSLWRARPGGRYGYRLVRKCGILSSRSLLTIVFTMRATKRISKKRPRSRGPQRKSADTAAFDKKYPNLTDERLQSLRHLSDVDGWNGATPVADDAKREVAKARVVGEERGGRNFVE